MVRLTDHLDTTIAVDWVVKQKQTNKLGMVHCIEVLQVIISK